MNGREIFESLPRTASRARDDAFVDHVKRKHYAPIQWTEIRTKHGPHSATLFVMNDALRLGDEDDSFRITPSAQAAQRIVDVLSKHIDDENGVSMLTTKIVDATFEQASRIVAPQTQSHKPTAKRLAEILRREPTAEELPMKSTARMLRHSIEVDEEIDGKCGLIAEVGKAFVLSNRLTRAKVAKRKDGSLIRKCANYGWHRGAGRMWQGPKGRPGLTHVDFFADYSQTFRAVRGTVLVSRNGAPAVAMRFSEVAQDPELCGLVYDESPHAPVEPLKILRMPGVALESAPQSGDTGEHPNDSADTDPALPEVTEPPPEDRAEPEFDFGDRDLRLLTPRLVGDDVAFWQEAIGAGVDGEFGPITDRRTRAWQRANGLKADGWVGGKTRAKYWAIVNGDIEPDEATPPDEPVDDDGNAKLTIPFVKAKNFTRAGRTDVKFVVIHTMEAGEYSKTAENVASWFAGASAPKASAHYNVDGDSIVQSVDERDVAWHAPGANRYGIGIEHAGYARQSRDEWFDPYSTAMLRLSAKLVAQICKRWGIPIEKISIEDLRAGKRGICGHVDVTYAFRKSTHVDPGKHFPWPEYLAMVKEFADAA